MLSYEDDSHGWRRAPASGRGERVFLSGDVARNPLRRGTARRARPPTASLTPAARPLTGNPGDGDGTGIRATAARADAGTRPPRSVSADVGSGTLGVGDKARRAVPLRDGCVLYSTFPYLQRNVRVIRRRSTGLTQPDQRDPIIQSDMPKSDQNRDQLA